MSASKRNWLLCALFWGTLSAALPGCGERSPQSADPSSTSASDSVRATDDVGREVALAGPARRIISLLPATTETLVALGARDLLVARTDYDDPSLGELPSVGGGLTPSLEMIASLRPDLVIAWEEAGSARIRPRLEAMGIAVFAVQTRDTADVFANIERLGSLTGLGVKADSLASNIRQELAAVQESVANRRRPSVLYLAGIDPPIVAGPELFIGELLSLAGGDNVFPELGETSPQMALEEILRRRPEVVLMPATGEGAVAIERLSGQPGWNELVRSAGTRIVGVPADVLHRPGPNIVQAAEILRAAIHPDLEAGVAP